MEQSKTNIHTLLIKSFRFYIQNLTEFITLLTLVYLPIVLAVMVPAAILRD